LAWHLIQLEIIEECVIVVPTEHQNVNSVDALVDNFSLVIPTSIRRRQEEIALRFSYGCTCNENACNETLYVSKKRRELKLGRALGVRRFSKSANGKCVHASGYTPRVSQAALVEIRKAHTGPISCTTRNLWQVNRRCWSSCECLLLQTQIIATSVLT
jgi:hypothetical protein